MSILSPGVGKKSKSMFEASKPFAISKGAAAPVAKKYGGSAKVKRAITSISDSDEDNSDDDFEFQSLAQRMVCANCLVFLENWEQNCDYSW